MMVFSDHIYREHGSKVLQGCFWQCLVGVILSFWESLLASREWKHSSVLQTALLHPMRVLSHCQAEPGFELESLPTWICELAAIL